MLKINCSVCNKELNEPGALLFSPPFEPENPFWEVDLTIKHHICVKCFKRIELENIINTPEDE